VNGTTDDSRLFPWQRAGYKHEEWLGALRKTRAEHVAADAALERFMESAHSITPESIEEQDRLVAAADAAEQRWRAVIRGDPGIVGEIVDAEEANGT